MVKLLVFHLLWLSVEHQVWASVIAPNWGVSQPKSFVYTSSAETLLLFLRKERWIFKNLGAILILVHWLGIGTYFILTVVILTHASYLK